MKRAISYLQAVKSGEAGVFAIWQRENPHLTTDTTTVIAYQFVTGTISLLIEDAAQKE